MKRFGKKALVIVGVLAVLVVAFYQIENWRGRRAVEKIRAEMSADGEPMTLAELMGDATPDDQNFFKAPLVSSLLDFELAPFDPNAGELYSIAEPIYNQPAQRERLLKMTLPVTSEYGYYKLGTGADGLSKKIMPDFEAWAEVFRADPEYEVSDKDNLSDAALILHAMNSRFHKEFELLNQAASRPFSELGVDRGETFEAHAASPTQMYSDCQKICGFLDLRISAAIAERNSPVFRESIRIQTQIFKGMGNDPILISSLLWSSLHGKFLGTLWGGFYSKSFGESDLQWIANELRGLDLASYALNARRGDIISFYRPSMTIIKGSPELATASVPVPFFRSSVPKQPSASKKLLVKMIPDGWWDQNSALSQQIRYREIFRRWKAMDFSGAKDIKAKLPATTHPYTILVASSVMEGIIERPMYIYVMNQCAILACEIEIYALRHGHYPNEIEDLIPEQIGSIPLDPFDGKPIKYVKTEERYLLYSIGWNESDENGEIASRGSNRVDKKNGDWVWDYRGINTKSISSNGRKEFLHDLRNKATPDSGSRIRKDNREKLLKAVTAMDKKKILKALNSRPKEKALPDSSKKKPKKAD